MRYSWLLRVIPSLVLVLDYVDSTFSLQLGLRPTFRRSYKRSIESNLALNDPNAICRNGGIYSGGICHCIHPQTGSHCQHFACVHGTSVGPRYDRNSLFFAKPCLCDDGWDGELCEYKLADKCGTRGEWKNNRCECIGFFFGSECQYTSRCIEGKIKNGRCLCNEHFEGDYCDRIVCYNGTPNFNNRSLSCICPPKYTGRHCNQCTSTNPLVERYPVCTIPPAVKRTVENAWANRRKQKEEMKKRLRLISLAFCFLVFFGALVFVGHLLRRKKAKADLEWRMKMKMDRHRLLTHEVMVQKLEEEMKAEREAEEEVELRRRVSAPDLMVRVTKSDHQFMKGDFKTLHTRMDLQFVDDDRFSKPFEL
ncbi:unnamed protein product [Caenorhabditis auriculariae]|uniref:EGF-like domain-containing protein n=1 Tax=Caenorhabditis auriculariae TaxID=2777116 RepID=A0A8S1GYR5_9PELO|nr:unnamed protein product [Caenorhabditis auriculariae]